MPAPRGPGVRRAQPSCILPGASKQKLLPIPHPAQAARVLVLKRTTESSKLNSRKLLSNEGVEQKYLSHGSCVSMTAAAQKPPMKLPIRQTSSHAHRRSQTAAIHPSFDPFFRFPFHSQPRASRMRGGLVALRPARMASTAEASSTSRGFQSSVRRAASGHEVGCISSQEKERTPS